MMGTEEKSTLELTVITATDLKKVRTFHMEQYYVVAYVDERRKVSSKVAMDATNPTWNWKPCFTVKGTETVTVEIYSHGTFSNKLVGTSTIAIRNVGTFRNSTTPMFYQVRRPSGKVKGTLTVSMKMKSLSSVGKANLGMGYEPNGVKAESSPVYPPRTAGHRDYASNAAESVYPPPKAGSAVPSSQVYPPLKESSSGTPSYGAGSADGAQVYPPPMPSGNGRDSYSSKVDEPVMAYPAPDYAAFQYPPNQHGVQNTQQYYPYSQASAAPYDYQQAYYSKPQRPRRQPAGGRSGMGMGLMSGALGGLLLGDMMGGDMGGDMGGF